MTTMRPARYVVAGRKQEPLDAAPDDAATHFPKIAVRHGLLEPRDAFATVRYDGDWFWIDNTDLATKRVFSFVMLLQSLSENSRPGQPPVISIPAG